ncbi:hypothetical protein [Fluviicola sp.]|uniref:hypothetical protein n=1 Tax=Fluviicola sp. TaxID=1917219 RepID=UPI0031D61FB9
MKISPEDVTKGENLFAAFTEESKRHFLVDIYAERTSEGYYKSLEHIYGCFPDFRKVVVVNIAISGNENDQLKLARELSSPYNQERIRVDFFELIYQWLLEAKNEKIIEALSRGLMFYIDEERTQNYLTQNIGSNASFAKGIISWLYIQPDWFREKYRLQEIEIWTQLNNTWPKTTFDEFQSREIEKSLGLNINNDELWFHEIENPWNYTDKKIRELSDLGVNIQITGGISEFAMASPLITDLELNNKKLPEAIGGPFVADDNNQFLCCTTFNRKEGFKLVAIDLQTNSITKLDSTLPIYCPYKFENNEFIVITKEGKIDLTKDVKRYKVPERKTTDSNTSPQNEPEVVEETFQISSSAGILQLTPSP